MRIPLLYFKVKEYSHLFVDIIFFLFLSIDIFPVETFGPLKTTRMYMNRGKLRPVFIVQTY